MKRWNVPAWLEREVVASDSNCVYCGVKFGLAGDVRKTKASWEHIVNDARITTRIITRENIAICCMSCNSSMGAKLLSDWLISDYCKSWNINAKTVASVVKEAIGTPPIWVEPSAQSHADEIL